MKYCQILTSSTGILIDFEVDQPFYIDAYWSLVSRDLGAIEMMYNNISILLLISRL